MVVRARLRPIIHRLMVGRLVRRKIRATSLVHISRRKGVDHGVDALEPEL